MESVQRRAGISMSAGVHCTPYFLFRNFPECEIIRVGNFELYREDKETYPVYDTQYLISEISRENDKTVVYMEVD